MPLRLCGEQGERKSAAERERIKKASQPGAEAEETPVSLRLQ